MKRLIFVCLLIALFSASLVRAETKLDGAIFYLRVVVSTETELSGKAKGVFFGPNPETMDSINISYAGTATMIDPDGYLAASSHALGPRYIVEKIYCSREEFSFNYLSLKKINVRFTISNGEKKYAGKYILMAENQGCLCEENDLIISFPRESEKTAVFLVEDFANDLVIVKIGGNNHDFIPIAPVIDPDKSRKLKSLSYFNANLWSDSGRLEEISDFDAADSYLGNRHINQEGFIQTSIPAIHGNSGGAVIDENGELIGIIAGIKLKKMEMEIEGEIYIKVISSYASKGENAARLLEKAKMRLEKINKPRQNKEG